jgi:hypothetical protein
LSIEGVDDKAVGIFDTALMDVLPPDQGHKPTGLNIHTLVDNKHLVVTGRHPNPHPGEAILFNGGEARLEPSQGFKVLWGAQDPRIVSLKPRFVNRNGDAWM